MAKKAADPELQAAVIALLESGDDTGCDGTIVVNVEEFRAVQDIIKERTGTEHGSVSPENVSNDGSDDDDDDDDEEDDEEDDEDDEDDEFEDDEFEDDDEDEFDEDD